MVKQKEIHEIVYKQLIHRKTLVVILSVGVNLEQNKLRARNFYTCYIQPPKS